MEFVSFKEVNAFLNRFTPGAIKDGDFYNLDKMYTLLPLLGSPQEKLNIVHVAGTSGKTSTSYYAASILQAAGAKTGLSVSPHIYEVNERVQVQGVPLAENEFCKLFSRFVTIPGFIDAKPTYFEILICFAFWAFAELGCTHAVMEVGLGGLKDATNVVENPNKICIITDIGLDHTRILGEKIHQIAAQKAGIIQPGNHVFCYGQTEEVDAVIAEQVRHQQAMLHQVDQVALETHAVFIAGLPMFQRRNWLLARTACELVIARDGLTQLDEKTWLHTQSIQVPARMQVWELRGKTIIMDGAHNPQKLTALVASLQKAYPNKSFTLLVAFSQAKESTLEDSLKLLNMLSNKIIATEFFMSMDLPHTAIKASELAGLAHHTGFTGIQVEADYTKAFQMLLNDPADIVLVCGSFYLIGSLLHDIKELQ